MKRISFALTVIKIYTKNQMQDLTNILLDSANMISRCLIVFLLYSYIFKINDGSLNGVSYEATLWSMFIYFVLMTLGVRKVYKLVMDDVRSGNVEMFMNKPINYVFLNFYRIIGQGLYSFVFISIIGCLLMVLLVGIPNLNLPIFIPTFILTTLLGQILGLLIYSCIGFLAFFIQDVQPIYWIADKLVMVLGGSYLPISLFPPFMKVMAFVFPLGAINFSSSTVYESWNSEYMIRLLLQCGWIIIFGLLLYFIFTKANKKAMINGG